MKRKVLCIFSLIAYLLLFCTCLAPTVERQMAVRADVKVIKAKTTTNTTLPAYSAQWGDIQGLFQIVEGSGWNTGSRVAEIPVQYYSNAGGHIILHPGTPYTLILSASRTPKEGDRVEPVETEESPNEKLIVYCPEGIQYVSPLQNNFTVLHQGEKGMLLDTMGIKMPYFEHRMKNALADRIMAEGLRIYSYSDAEGFLRQLPLAAVPGAVLLFALTVWAGICRIVKKQQPGWLLWMNAGILGLTLLLPGLVGGKLELPASLMPPDNILNIAHYRQEFSNMFAALAEAGERELQNLSLWCTAAAVAVLLAGAALGILLLWMQQKLIQKKTA